MDAPEDRLGLSQSSDDVRRMTALIPQADVAGSRRDVSEVPEAALSRCSKMAVVRLFDHFLGEQLHRIGDFNAQRLGCLHLDDEFEFSRLNHGQISSFLAFKHPPDIDAHQSIHVCQTVAICHQATSPSELG
jgi:hypothetical protein